jgi:polysaccharide pyruvyl transferase WcaK-like protein
MIVKQSAKRIGLIGPFGFGNLGDAAIQDAMIQNIKRYFPEAVIYGFSLNPEDTETRHNIKSFPIGRMANRGWLKENSNGKFFSSLETWKNSLRANKNPLIRLFVRVFLGLPLEILAIMDASRNVRGLDFFIISGGGQLDDYWGGPWNHPYSLWIWSLLAKTHKVKLLFVSVGAGPIDRKLSQWFIRSALSLADYRSYRDEKSKRLIEKIGFARNDPVYPDLAHSLYFLPEAGQNERLPEDAFGLKANQQAQRWQVGIGPIAYFDPRVWPQKDQTVYMNYLGKLSDFSAWLIQHGYTIRLFPGEAEHDRLVIADFLKLLEDKTGLLLNDKVFYQPVDTVHDLLEQLSKMDLVIASRFHGVLLAQLLNKPVLALSYHPKIDELMQDTGQASYCLSIETAQVKDMINLFDDMGQNLADLKVQLKKRIDEYRNLLDKQYEHIFNL